MLSIVVGAAADQRVVELRGRKRRASQWPQQVR